jgi:Hypothetical protein (DUF2513)
MRLDPDAVRTILLDLERESPVLEPLNGARWFEVAVEGKSVEEISEHIRLMTEAGLIEAIRLPKQAGFFWYPTRMKWHGHQYLDSVRADSMYAKTKEIASKAFGTISLETIKLAIPIAVKAILASHGVA